MQTLLHNEEDFENLLDNNSRYNTPDSYPCLAVGFWEYNPIGPDGYTYEFVYLTLFDDTRYILSEF